MDAGRVDHRKLKIAVEWCICRWLPLRKICHGESIFVKFAAVILFTRNGCSTLMRLNSANKNAPASPGRSVGSGGMSGRYRGCQGDGGRIANGEGQQGWFGLPPSPELTQRSYVSRDVTGLDARQVHVRHLGMRIKQKRRDARLAEARPLGDVLKRRGIRIGLPLSEADDMARSAPPFRQPLAVKGVSGQCGADSIGGEGCHDYANRGNDERNSGRAHVGTSFSPMPKQSAKQL
jgi:hypothetical protein